MEKNRVTIHISSKDRHTELALLLESLRHQSFQDFDVIILDDASGAPIGSSYFIQYYLNRLKLEGHKVKLLRNNVSFGCCAARNKLIDEDSFDNEYTFRCDDDVLLKEDYIERLVNVIEKYGYDMASGVVPHFGVPEMIRETKFISPIINKHELNDKGELIMNNDDCGYCYDKYEVLPTDQFRTNCLYKSEINKKISYPVNLSTVAFREEGFFSMGAIIEGYKIGVDTGAICWHLQCPSGGNRRPDYAQCVQLDEETWRKWLKMKFDKHGDFLSKYHKEVLKEC
jgi:glycosyltransferase involved in cell wall biosynthesis